MCLINSLCSFQYENIFVIRNSIYPNFDLITEVSKWTGNDSAVDVLVRPEMIARVARFLREREVKYDVIIPDLQQAIDQENPIDEEALDELAGRKGLNSTHFRKRRRSFAGFGREVIIGVVVIR